MLLHSNESKREVLAIVDFTNIIVTPQSYYRPKCLGIFRYACHNWTHGTKEHHTVKSRVF